jgi:hypothetical protein
MKSKLILGAIALALALTSGALGQGKNATPAAPKLVIAETDHNFGEVKAGEKLQHTFTFKNEGTADLVIQSVTPG